MVSFRAGRPVSIKKCGAAAVLLAAIASVSACGNAGANRPDAKVVAIVNGREITLRQLERSAPRPRTMSAAEDDVEKVRAVEDAVDQELLVQRALETKLHRRPEIVEEIDRATRRVLAQAYLRQVTVTAGSAVPAEIREFYRANPALFAARRIYWLQELRARLTAEQEAALTAHATGARRLKDIARWLQSQRIAFEVAVSTRAAEELPLEMLDQLSGMKDGQSALFIGSGGVSVVELVQSQAVPLTEEEATPLVRRYLAGGRQQQLAAAEVARLRQRARIEYGADFERLRTAGSVAEVTPAGSPPPPRSIERGMSGL